MVSTEEMRIRNKSPSLSVSTNSSAPQVLLTETPHRVQDTRTNKERDNRNNNKTEVCQNFGRGVCRWGATCSTIFNSVFPFCPGGDGKSIPAPTQSISKVTYSITPTSL
ncbi:hybrid signal transduction histidine kinase M [Tanacetum coccineum]|uniref:Hybrid signal transduction histidine kinase M n=1 Tax=Tanacetum coccineum TaxID=301880 RepID=A0ABQ5C955_9ASTR